MDETNYMKANQARWDELVDIHQRSAFYDVASFKAGRISLSHLERTEVGDVSGKSLLHLQCHFGMDTLSWARLGARVTGVDFSEQAIALAGSLSQELGIDARFVRSNIYDLPDESLISEQFDIVYTANGVLGWLPDLTRWGRLIAHYLKPGGIFYLFESHPFMFTLDENDAELKVTYPYFSREALRSENDSSYASSEKVLEHKIEYNWYHSFAEIFDALLSNGLALEFLHEYDFSSWKYFQNMHATVIDGDTWYRLDDPQKQNMVPLMFSLKARKR